MMPTIHWSEMDQKFWIATNEGPIWFESILEAKRALREIELQHAAKAEREQIVEWLRSDADALLNCNGFCHSDIIAEAIVECAQAIAAGEHLK